jgi:outer membrane protein OmpA-like peptidoglycan-associated protein/tetratricopeptide (TPR) repeat protein
MPKLKKLGLTLTLAGSLLANVYAQQESPILKEALRHYELLSYATAIPKFEQILKEGASLSSSDKLSTLLKLANSYLQTKDSQNSERVYRDIFTENKTLSGSDQKAYLYYAQVLANVGKFKESQEYFDKYNSIQPSEFQSFTAQAPKVTRSSSTASTLTNENSKYNVEFLSINTNRPEFSPVYYKEGIVYCSGKGSGVKMLNEKGGSFLDLYYQNDLSKVVAVTDGNGEKIKPKRVASGGTKSLGKDYYSQPTANDSRTLNFFGTNDDVVASVPKAKGQLSESEIFSKTLNTKYHEGPATFTQDFSTIIFTRNNFNEGQQGASEDNVTKLKLYTADATNNGWGEVSELPFNSDEHSTAHPALSKDGRFLYFATDMEGGEGGMDIFMAEKNKAGEWSEARPLGKTINSTGNELFPYVDEKGNLYYSSEGLPGKGGLDIFFIEMKNGKPVGKPVNIGEPFNGPNDDFGIITNAARSEGYFSSDRKTGEDDDIYRFSRQGSAYGGCREVTINIFDPEQQQGLSETEIEIATKGGKTEKKKTDENGNISFCSGQDLDYTLRVTKGGYITNIIGYSTKGEADDAPSRLEVPLMKVQEQIVEQAPPALIIESSKVIPAEVPKNAFIPSEKKFAPAKKSGSVLKGVVKTEIEKTPIEGVLVTFRNDCDNSKQEAVTGADGIYTFEMTDGCDYTLEVTKEGYGANVNKINRIKKGKGKEISQDLGLFKEGDEITNDNIYYDSGKAAIRKDAARELDKLAATLQKNPEMVIEIGSHTDSRGDAGVNQELSDKRANAAVDYIAKKGVDRSRMLAKGYGESRLLNECLDGVTCTESEHQKNRRTTVKIIKVK